MVLTWVVLQLYLDCVCSENQYRVLRFANKKKGKKKKKFSVYYKTHSSCNKLKLISLLCIFIGYAVWETWFFKLIIKECMRDF